MLRADKLAFRVFYLVFWFLWIIGVICFAFMLPALLAVWLAHLTGMDRQLLSAVLFIAIIGVYGVIGRRRLVAPAQFVIDYAEGLIASDFRKKKPSN